jgi:hypothetical protein
MFSLPTMIDEEWTREVGGKKKVYQHPEWCGRRL